MSRVDPPSPAGELPEAEVEALRSVGIRLDGPPGDPTGARQVAAGKAADEALRRRALTRQEAADALGLSVEDLSELIAAGEVVTVAGVEGDVRLPEWQFLDGSLLPGLVEVAPVLQAVHPLSAEGFLRRPDPDLYLGGRGVSPLEWLAADQNPRKVAALASGLRGF